MKCLLYFLAGLFTTVMNATAQFALPFGLQDKNITAIAISNLSPGKVLYATTENAGVFCRNLAHPDSSWRYLGLSGKKLLSLALYRTGAGPMDFDIPVVGADIDVTAGDSVLIYRLAESGWVPADSGIDRQQLSQIRALASVPSSGHMPPGVAFAGGNGPVYRSHGLFTFWQPALVYGIGVTNALAVFPSNQPGTSGLVWAGGENAIFAPWIARSSDNGITWETFYPDLGGDNACDALAIHPYDDNTVYAGMEGAVIKTTDDGKTWHKTQLIDKPVYFYGLALDVNDPDHIYAGGVTDGTNQWAMWESFDGGSKWLPVEPALPQISGISDLAVDPVQRRVVYIATLGNGVWRYQTMYSWDAVILTLRLQQDIHLDEILATEIDQVLVAARPLNDSLQSIHALPDYVPTDLIIFSDAAWTDAWRNGQLLTGHPVIDSLGQEYRLDSVEAFGRVNMFLLEFAKPLKMSLLAKVYQGVPGVINASPNGIIGDGDRIEAFNKGGDWYLVFSHGWGDCPAGCTERKYWYILVHNNLSAELVKIWLQDYIVARIHLWNIPDRYAATVFTTIHEIFSAARSAPEWWVRRHAVEVMGRLFECHSPWVNEDLRNRTVFDFLRNSIRQHPVTVIEILTWLLDDPDPDVRISADQALNKVMSHYGDYLAYYLPLNIGNNWHFTDGLQILIQDTVRYKDGLYFRADSSMHGLAVDYRFTRDNQVIYRSGDVNQVWLDFSAAIGDSWQVSLDQDFGMLTWTVTLKSKTDVVNTPAGTFTDCYRFKFDFHGMDNSFEEWYAPEVGWVKFIHYGFEQEKK